VPLQLLGYREVKRHGWVWWLDRAHWRDEWAAQVEECLREMRNVIRESRHARTAVVTLPDDTGGTRGYFKLYHSPDWSSRFKDVFRASRALRSLRMSVRLAAEGFGAPQVLAAGEQLRAGFVGRGFLLTAAVPGLVLHEVPPVLARYDPSERRHLKRTILQALGAEVARFHARGYLHGDLVHTNLMVRWNAAVHVWFLDHDRTRLAWPVLRGRRQRRNLVQLNRLRIDDVSHSDRLRLLRSYGTARGWSPHRVRREARRIARKTLAIRPPAPRDHRRAAPTGEPGSAGLAP